MEPPDAMGQPRQVAEQEKEVILGSMPESRINEPLLVHAVDYARCPIKRKPVAPESSLGNYQAQGPKSQPSSSQTVLEIRSARIEEEVGCDVKFGSGIGDVHDGRDNVTLADKGWPASPRTVPKWSGGMVLEICLYILMAIGAVMFLAFALLAASMDRTFLGTNLKYSTGGPIPVAVGGYPYYNIFYPNGTAFVFHHPTPLNAHLLEAAKLGPTIFPILFSGVVGSFLRLVARTRAEKGSTTEFLEILLGSRSLPSTISTVFSLGTISLVEIGLVLLWMLSPIGGQASLRILNVQNVTGATTNSTWGAVNPAILNTNNLEDSLQLKADYISAFNSIARVGYSNTTTSVMSRDSRSGAFYPIIPIAADNNYPPVFNLGSQWQSLKENLTFATSLVGFQVQGPLIFPAITTFIGKVGVSYEANMSFTISYSQFRCPSVSQDLVNGSWTSMLGPDFIYANFSQLLQKGKYGSGFFVDTNDTFDSDIEGPQNFLFGSFYGSKVTLWSCLLYSSTRNVNLTCSDFEQLPSVPFMCEATSVGAATLSDVTPFNAYTLAANLYRQWPEVDSPSAGVSSLTERYIANGFNWQNNSYWLAQPSLVDLSVLDNVTFANRLTTVFNTYTQITQLNPFDNNQLQYSASATHLLWLPFEVVACNWVYFTILTLASIILLICSTWSILLRCRISTPDIFGYLSSSIIENPYVPIPGVQPGSGSTLSGLQRSKLLGKMKLQLRDIQENEEFGKLALTNQVRKVPRRRKDRKFV